MVEGLGENNFIEGKAITSMISRPYLTTSNSERNVLIYHSWCNNVTSAK